MAKLLQAGELVRCHMGNVCEVLAQTSGGYLVRVFHPEGEREVELRRAQLTRLKRSERQARRRQNSPAVGMDTQPNPWRDRLHGGRGDRLTPADVDPEQLRMGIAVEREHVAGDRHLQTEIALDHLAEDPRYYSKLAIMERGNPIVPVPGAAPDRVGNNAPTTVRSSGGAWYPVSGAGIWSLWSYPTADEAIAEALRMQRLKVEIAWDGAHWRQGRGAFYPTEDAARRAQSFKARQLGRDLVGRVRKTRMGWQHPEAAVRFHGRWHWPPGVTYQNPG